MARPNTETRASRAEAATQAPRPMVRRLGGAPLQYEVVFDERTAYDFLVSLEVGEGPESDILPEDRRWLKQSLDLLSADARAELDLSFREEKLGPFHGLEAIVVDHPEVRTAAEVVQLFDDTPPAEIARRVIDIALRDPLPTDVMDRAVQGDAAAIAQVQAQMDDVHKDGVTEFLGNVPERIQRMRRALSQWLPHFQEIEKRIAGYLARDVASRADDRKRLEPAALVEKVTGGLRFLPDAQLRRVILAPSYFSRPFNYIFEQDGWRLFAYPVADAVLETQDPSLPPPQMVRLYRALGDPTRMRILKLLSDRDWYLTELATQLELSKPTTKHHLALLRAAGLVTITEEAHFSYYSLRRERLAEAGSQLLSFLG